MPPLTLGYRILLSVCCLSMVRTTLSLSSVVPRQPLGRVKSLDRSKLDNIQDTTFYQQPKLVTHTDADFIDQLKNIYREYLPSNDNLVVLDMMASHISHLPEDVTARLARLDVHGMNEEELQQNKVREATSGNLYLRDLNANPSFVGLCEDESEGTYDAVICCVGVQYLEEAEVVLADTARLLKPGSGTIIISFTNRFFYRKALQGWINRGMMERGRLVSDYLRAAGGYDDIQVVGDGRSVWNQVSSLVGITGDPFVAVVAKRSKA